MEITQFQWFRQIIPIQTQIWRELRITSSCRCLPSESSTLNSLCSGASSCNSAGKPEHWAGSSNRGRCCSTQHPFITGTTRIVILSQVPQELEEAYFSTMVPFVLSRRYFQSRYFSSQGTFGSVHTGKVRCCQYLGRGEEETRLVAVWTKLLHISPGI